MGDTLNHLEKVIRDVPNGSFTVEPLNHIEKVIQEVGQEIAQSQGGSGELYEHHITFADTVDGSWCYFSLTLITNSSSPFTITTLADYLIANGLTSMYNLCSASGYRYYANYGNVIAGIFGRTGNQNFAVIWWSQADSQAKNSVISRGSMTDVVIQILGGE